MFYKTEINEAFEVHEIERLTALKITISNAFIYEISTLNEFLYDIDLASKVINSTKLLFRSNI